MESYLKLFLPIVFILSVSACTSQPYVTKTVINEAKQERIETICTNKRAVIPWYIGVAAGFFTYKYGERCEDVTTSLDQNSRAAAIIENEKIEVEKNREANKTLEDK
jgi:hypothetical protein